MYRILLFILGNSKLVGAGFPRQRDIDPMPRNYIIRGRNN